MAGDSWGCGEWIPRDPNIVYDHPNGWNLLVLSHRGLSEYLESHDTVINLSKPGSSNFSALNKVRTFLDINYNLTSGVKKVFLFETSWWRDFNFLWYYTWLDDKKHLHKNFDGRLGYVGLDESKHPLAQLKVDNLADLGRLIVHKWYNDLNELGQERNVEMVIIGGLSDCQLDFPDMSHLKFGCRSMVNLALHNNEVPTVWQSGGTPVFSPTLLEIAKDLWPQSLEKDIVYLDQFEQRENIIYTRTDLFPDGSHADRHCHYKVYKLLEDKGLL